MIVEEVVENILDVPKYYFICHASSCECKFGSGLAKDLNDAYKLKECMEKKYYRNEFETGDFAVIGNVITLFVKELDSDKVGFAGLTDALKHLKNSSRELGIKYLAFPKICCGKMGLDWRDVKKLIKNIFENTDIHILFCYENETDLTITVEDINDLIENNFSILEDEEKRRLYDLIENFFEDRDVSVSWEDI